MERFQTEYAVNEPRDRNVGVASDLILTRSRCCFRIFRTICRKRGFSVCKMPSRS